MVNKYEPISVKYSARLGFMLNFMELVFACSLETKISRFISRPLSFKINSQRKNQIVVNKTRNFIFKLSKRNWEYKNPRSIIH